MANNTPAKPQGGVLQIPVAATQKNASSAPKKTPKPAAPRLKLLVRRLPPGLTRSEFEHVLGPDWMVGAGKVDWFQYKPGKVSKDPAKPSRPSRAYVHVVSSDHTIPLSNKVRTSSFIDARNTANDPVLLGPPSVEFAPYAKIPSGRVRKDARQGTIDQDPDFIAFLESLTQPITKPAAAESTPDSDDKKDGPIVTPLVQYIREKKANKAKDGSKSSKHGRSDKDGKGKKAEKVQAKKLLSRADKDREPAAPSDKPEKKSKGDKAAKEAVKAANKAASTAKQTSNDSTPSTAAGERKRERGNVSAAAKILQRDLGMAQSGGRRKGGKGATDADDATKNENGDTAQPSKKETPSKPPKGGSQAKGRGNNSNNTTTPTNELSETNTPPSNATPPAKPSRSGKAKTTPAATPTATATQAFLKHANPSQGVTEQVLDEAFGSFGKIVKTEIDKKKGFGYVDFAEPEGLQKAMAASPVTVAQSQVVVLERKLNPGGEKSRGKAAPAGGGGGGGGNSSGSRGGKPEGSSSRGRGGGRGKNKGGGGAGKGGGSGNNNNAGGSGENGDSK